MYAKKANPKRAKMFTKSKYVKKAVDVRKIVKSEVNKMAEVKCRSETNIAQALNSYNTVTPAIPTMIDFRGNALTLSQGTGQGERVGNKVSLKSCRVRFLFQNREAGENVVVRFVIAKLKGSIATPILSDFATLFQDGNSSTAPTNIMSQTLGAYFNKDYWDVKKTFTFKLNAIGADNNTWQPFNGGGQYYQKDVDLSKYLPKTIIYNDANTTPQNCGLYGFILASSPIAANDYTIRCDARINMMYTDL